MSREAKMLIQTFPGIKGGQNEDAPAAAGLNYYTPYLRGTGLLPKKGESLEHILLEKMKLEESAKKKESEKDKK